MDEMTMEEMFGWSMDDFFEEEPETPEEAASRRRWEAQEIQNEMYAEMHMARYCFD